MPKANSCPTRTNKLDVTVNSRAESREQRRCPSPESAVYDNNTTTPKITYFGQELFLFFRVTHLSISLAFHPSPFMLLALSHCVRCIPMSSDRGSGSSLGMTAKSSNNYSSCRQIPGRVSNRSVLALLISSDNVAGPCQRDCDYIFRPAVAINSCNKHSTRRCKLTRTCESKVQHRNINTVCTASSPVV